MEKEIELFKIQAYTDYLNSDFTIHASYILGAIVAYYFTVFGLKVQNFMTLEAYTLFIFVPFPFFVIWWYRTDKNHVKDMSRIDELLKKFNNMESIPSIKEMISGKAWKIEKE